MAISGIQSSNSNYLILQAASSINGITTPTGSVASFGTVRTVFTGCGFFGVGDSVMFDNSKAIRFFKSSINYFIVDQQYVFLTETPAS